MARRRKNGSFAGFLFAFLLLFIISLIILVWGITTYDSSKMQQTTEEDEDLEKDDNRQFGDIIKEQEDLEEQEEEKPEQETTEDDLSADATQIEDDTKNEDAASYRRMYRQLSGEEQDIYEIVQRTLSEGGSICTIEKIYGNVETAQNKLIRAIDAVYYDYPEYFWFNHNSRWTYWDNGDSLKVEVELYFYEYWEYVLNKKAYIDDVNEKAQEIANEASKLESTYDKVKYVHDYLVTYAEYDYVAYEEINQTVQRASNQQSHTVYGCLVSRLSVCDGYAKTFQMIMNLLGIEAEYIEGDADGPHAWNYIYLDGENYWMDVTWDDANRRNEDGSMAYPEGVDYGYFCITTNDLTKTHIPNNVFEVPECTATEYNFFYRENSYLQSYNFEEFCRALEEQNGEQIISVKFSSERELKVALDDLFNVNYRYMDLPGIGGKQFSYSYDEKQCILSLLLNN